MSFLSVTNALIPSDEETLHDPHQSENKVLKETIKANIMQHKSSHQVCNNFNQTASILQRMDILNNKTMLRVTVCCRRCS